MDFSVTYKKLNDAQRKAVDTIDGPVLVIAGPGTGKTQLLSARVANILKKTDTLPQNILCLTFTENGAANMRERLSRFIGQGAYDVTISTYHAFGADLIRSYSQYFNETRELTPIDTLTKHQILAELVEKLSYSNPLKQTQHHIGDLMSTISEVKRALLNGDDLRAISRANLLFIAAGSKMAADDCRELNMRQNIHKVLPIFEALHQDLQTLAKTSSLPFGSLAQLAVQELAIAIETAAAAGKTPALTKWKNDWLVKNDQDQFIIDGLLQNKRIEALASLFDDYQKVLDQRSLYDFDDMILRAIQTLEENNDLKFTLQERYQYILLDEFQDTNAAQLRMVELLSDNPVHEGRPNVLAVGDDDQAIYAFQGAQYSNMLDFFQMYQDVKVINLTDNYRSHADILSSSTAVAEQIAMRLHHQFDGLTKTIKAVNDELPKKAVLVRNECPSDDAQYFWIATQIKQLIDKGTHPREIAVLAPKHKHLEPLVPFLNSLGVPVRYERRENILEASIVKQLLTMSRLILAIADGKEDLANALWPIVLSYDFWKLPTSTIWQLSWQVRDSRHSARARSLFEPQGPASARGRSKANPVERPGGAESEGDLPDIKITWSSALLASEKCRPIALLFLSLAARQDLETCETILDCLIGTETVTVNETDMETVRSPLRDYYANELAHTTRPELFYETVSQLKVMRARLREHQAVQDTALGLRDLLKFVEMYEAAGEQMINTNPYAQASDAVQLMTVFKAKGLEFEHVFLPSCLDDVWGSSSRTNSNKLTLPANLMPIRHAGATEDERLRLLFVALTRAKHGLYLASYTQTYTGKPTKRLKYFDEQEQAEGGFRAMILPEAHQLVQSDGQTPPTIELLELDWRSRHEAGDVDLNLRTLLEHRLTTYKLSPTHVNTFVDLVYGGPQQFFFNNLLLFPQAPTATGQYGNTIHETLEWYQLQVTADTTDNLTARALSHFETQMKRKKLTAEQIKLEVERGKSSLSTYLEQRGHIFTPKDKAEHNFWNEAIIVSDALLTGAVDRLEVNETDKTITVVDFKTSKGHERWSNEIALHKYRQQLYLYKLLIEHSRAFAGYKVTKGRLEFTEPTPEGKILYLELDFEPEELQRVTRLLSAVWEHVIVLNFPNTAAYTPDLKGTKAFEQDLIDGVI